jgi:hypothetical protein
LQCIHRRGPPVHALSLHSSQHETGVTGGSFSSLLLGEPLSRVGSLTDLIIGGSQHNGPGCRPLVRTRGRQLYLDRHPEGGLNSNISRHPFLVLLLAIVHSCVCLRRFFHAGRQRLPSLGTSRCLGARSNMHDEGG